MNQEHINYHLLMFSYVNGDQREILLNLTFLVLKKIKGISINQAAGLLITINNKAKSESSKIKEKFSSSSTR